VRRRRLPKQHESAEEVREEARRVEHTFRRKREEAHATLVEAIGPLHDRSRKDSEEAQA